MEMTISLDDVTWPPVSAYMYVLLSFISLKDLYLVCVSVSFMYSTRYVED